MPQRRKRPCQTQKAVPQKAVPDTKETTRYYELFISKLLEFRWTQCARHKMQQIQQTQNATDTTDTKCNRYNRHKMQQIQHKNPGGPMIFIILPLGHHFFELADIFVMFESQILAIIGSPILYTTKKGCSC